MTFRQTLIKMMQQNSWTFLSLVIIIGMFGLLSFVQKSQEIATQAQAQKMAQQQIGGPFTLQTQHKEPFSEANLLGKYTLLFFGYTYCPDICPTTLNTVANVYDSLSKEEQNLLQVVFVSVDPKRDTPETLANYMSAFQADFIALTGEGEQIAKMAKAYQVYYQIHPPEDPSDPENYLVDHSGFLYLMSPTGTFLTHFPYSISSANLRTRLLSFLAQ